MKVWVDLVHVGRVVQANDEIERKHGLQVTACGSLSMIEGEARYLASRFGTEQAYELVSQAADRIVARGAAELKAPEIPPDRGPGQKPQAPVGRFSRFLQLGATRVGFAWGGMGRRP